MKIDFIKSRRFLPASLVVMLMLLLAPIMGTAQQIQYNDTRIIVILPESTQTQRPGEATVSQDTKEFCSGDDYFFISSSAKGRKVSHDYSAYLQFNLAAIPQGAIIDTVDLMIYLNKVKNTSSVFEQGVALYELSSAKGNQVINIADSSSVALSLVSRNDTTQAIHLQPEISDGLTWASKRKGNLYCILAAEEAETYRYYTARSGYLSKQPKLVISYHLPANQTRKMSWPQYKYDAQHTAMLGWQSNTTASGFKINDAFSPTGSNYIKSDPLLNDDKLIMAYQTSTLPMYRLLTLSQQGKYQAETTSDVIGLVKYGPIADRNSNIYYISGHTGGTLTVLGPEKMPVITPKQLENNAQAIAVPVIGFDGSIYLSTDKGIYAYTPQPEFKLKWTYALATNRFGTVALNEAEEAVYVYDGTNGKIIALNSRDGIEKWRSNIGSTFTTDIPVPSVKNGRLCITNGLRKGDRFYIMDANDGHVVKTITAGTAVISQPVIGTDKVFIINNGRLEAYALSDGAIQSAATITGLNPSSALALDANDNVYILNTEQGQQSLTMVAPGATTFPSVLIDDAKGYLTGNRLILTPEGSLLTGNDNHLYSISPTGFSLKDDITIPFDNDSEFKSEYLYRSEGMIRVAGKTVTSTQNMVIHAGKGVTFQSGFSVQLGATVSCKAGF